MSAAADSIQWEFHEKGQAHKNSGKKKGISLAIPPNGTTEEEQVQDIWGDWKNIKILYKKT